MNLLLSALAAYCKAHPLDEKILIAPTKALGRQFCDVLTREGVPWVHLRIETLSSLALGILCEELSHNQIRFLSRTSSRAFIEQACSAPSIPFKYFDHLREESGLHRSLDATVYDLRLAGLKADELKEEFFEDPRKGADLSILLRDVEMGLSGAEKNTGRFLDDAGLLQLALQKLRNEHFKNPSGSEVSQASSSLPSLAGHYLLPSYPKLNEVELELVQLLAQDRLHWLETDDPETWHKGLDLPIQLFKALGEENEVREVFRRLLDQSISLEQVELIHTDTGTYVPLIYELSAENELPVTFSEGIPVIFSRPGRLLMGLLEWISDHYDVSVLYRIFAAGCIDFSTFSEKGEDPGAVRAARALREALIGWGRNRYLSALSSRVARLSQAELISENEDEFSPSEQHHQLDTAKTVLNCVARLLELIPEPDTRNTFSFQQLAGSLVQVLEGFSLQISELDGRAAVGLRRILWEITTLPVSDLRLPLTATVQRLQSILREARVDARNPQPGHLHVSGFQNGGYSNRRNVYLVGMDESRFPGENLQDPILLNKERERINQAIAPRELSLHGNQARENRLALWCCLARLRGKLTASYSCRNLLENREQESSGAFLEIHRRGSGEVKSNYRELHLSLGEPEGFIPTTEVTLQDSEWWFQKLSALGKWRTAPSVLVAALAPWLQRGYQALQARNGEEFTSFDGFVNSGEGFDPRHHRKPVSASVLEKLAQCPFAYYMKYVLEIDPPQELARDPDCWLGPLDFGQLVHRIFYDFMIYLHQQKEKPSVGKHWNTLKQTATNQLEVIKQQIPPPNEVAIKKDQDRLLATCMIFLKNEEKHCRDRTPFGFEISFGSRRIVRGDTFSCSDPVSVDLIEGGPIFLRGRIDRMDQREGDGNYEVWDYKTGGLQGVEEHQQLNGGRQLQHALYAIAAETLLNQSSTSRKPGLGAPKVITSGYFFPNARGMGHRIAKEQNLDLLRGTLGDLFGILREGVFFQRGDEKGCGFCDYQSVCGNLALLKARCDSKLRNSANRMLEPIRRLDDREKEATPSRSRSKKKNN